MTEPIVAAPAAPEPVYEPWVAGAVAVVMRQFKTYALERMINGDLDECRQQAGVSEASAELFEDALNAISEDEDDDENGAAPGLPGSWGESGGEA